MNYYTKKVKTIVKKSSSVKSQISSNNSDNVEKNHHKCATNVKDTVNNSYKFKFSLKINNFNLIF